MRSTGRSLARDENGQVIAIVAISSVVILLFAALVIDVGNWYSHKRQLQNRADAGALAARTEYASQFTECAKGGDPRDLVGQAKADAAGAAIARTAQRYAGLRTADPGTGYDPIATPPFNTETANQLNTEVFINSKDEDSLDPDGGGPCFKHPPDAVSPDGGYWTDVRVKEKNLNSFFGSLGIPLTRNIARARVALLESDTLVRGAMPFIGETGDIAPCAWVQFVRDDGTNNDGDPVGPLTLLTGTGPRVYDSSDIRFQMPAYSGNISARITLGSFTNGQCSFSTSPQANQVSFQNFGNSGNPPNTGLAFLHSGYNGPTLGPTNAPAARSITIDPGSCPDAYFIKSAADCNVGVQAVIDFGDPNDPVGNLGASVTATMGGVTRILSFGAGQWRTSSTDFLIPSGSGRRQFTVAWARTKGTVGADTCTNDDPCTGNFGGFNQMVYAANDASGPVAKLQVLAGSTQPGFAPAGTSVSLRVHLELSTFDKAKTVLIRGSVQGTGNRTSAVDCGYGVGTPNLAQAIRFGCPPAPPGLPRQYKINVRQSAANPPQPTFSCVPFSLSTTTWDCLNDQQITGNRTIAVQKALEDRFPCTKNNFPTDPTLIKDWTPTQDDPRLSTIFLTTYGSLAGSGDVPIVGFQTVYITGFERDTPCAASVGEEGPPAGATAKGTELWGHYITRFFDLSGRTTPGPKACDLSLSDFLCVPALVR